ncbi:Ig-like domain-containing protein [Sandarakinorhabdus sp. AAP62]|uniref:Ig-like domain-containing protein n=1 Tax=Sandarakinorhabdus sp. AAP62 TaxID=1248916 RepID=UPI0003121342|nr:Ig-like domain-containing protein [Sandarakinorhabdus sp. AAP62]
MSTTRFQLSTGDYTQDWSTASGLLSNDNWDLLPSIVGFRGDDLVGGTGIDPRTIVAAATSGGVVDLTITATSPTTFTTGGVLFFTALANPTIALNGSGTADAPSIALFLDSTGRQDIRFQANIRDLDASADNAVQQVAVQWRVADGSWNNVAYIADATTAGSDTQVTAIDVTLPAGANDSASLEIRIITTNAAGNDEAIGIDDIIVSSVPLEGGDTTPPVLIGSNPTDPDDGATAVPLGSDIVLRFSEAVQAGTGSFTLSNGSDVRVIAVTDPQVSISGSTVTINPSTDLVAGTTYSLTAPAGILEDAAGNDFGGIAAGVLDFTTLQPQQLRTIGEIQGLGHTSGFVGQVVQTEGVVTAIDTNGYYIQSALGASDGNADTSDGIFVFTNSAPSVAVGQLLRVTATVSEFRPGGDTRNLTITQLTSPIAVLLGTGDVESVTIGSGGRLPPTQIIDNDSFGTYDPGQDGIDFWESLEGMRITIDAPIAISNTNSFTETYVVASGGAGATGQSAGGGLTIAADDFNPERIQLDNDNGLFAGFTNNFSIGDRLSNVTGIVSYSFQSFEVLVTAAVTTTTDVTATKEVTSLTEAADKLSVASYNLENLSANDAPAKLASLASDIVNNLKSPDIIGVQEIQDADGAGPGADLSGAATAAALIAAIQAAGGPTYAYVEIAPSAPGTTGGEPGGNIRNGFFYDPARVSLVPGSVELIDGPAFTNSRRPLAATFEFNGEAITLVNVHFTSRGGSDGLWGSIQPPANAADAARTAQGEAVRAWIDGRPSAEQANIVVLGDFNGFTWEGGIGALTRGGLMSNLSDLLPVAERYSFQFDGNNQQLDHIIATGSLAQRAEFDAVHINSQLTEAAQISTDHDAMLALFTVPVKINGTTAGELIQGTAAAETITALGGNDFVFAGGGNDTVLGGDGADTIRGGTGTNRLFGDAGNDIFGGDLEFGVHFIDGGAGADTFMVTSAGEKVIIDLNNGTVIGGYANGSTLTSIEAVNARNANFAVEFTGRSVAETLTGGRLADILSGGGGNDRIIGGRGADMLTGGSGNDTFVYQRGEVTGDIILDFQGAGVAGGDVLVLTGFGLGAALTNVGDIWTVSYGAGLTETFQIVGVTSLGAGDVIFG